MDIKLNNPNNFYLFLIPQIQVLNCIKYKL